jgi:LmbE family N-acetylglucosaminyl deacetylase
VVRRHRPQIVITTNFRETWDGHALNQADHIAVGRAASDAARDAGNRWVFPEQLTDGVGPWGGVRQVWAASSPDAGHGADVTATFDRGLESLRAHKTYLEGLGSDGPDPAEFLEGFARATGGRLGCDLGVAFEVFPLQLF